MLLPDVPKPAAIIPAGTTALAAGFVQPDAGLRSGAAPSDGPGGDVTGRLSGAGAGDFSAVESHLQDAGEAGFKKLHLPHSEPGAALETNPKLINHLTVLRRPHPPVIQLHLSQATLAATHADGDSIARWDDTSGTGRYALQGMGGGVSEITAHQCHIVTFCQGIHSKEATM